MKIINRLGLLVNYRVAENAAELLCRSPSKKERRATPDTAWEAEKDRPQESGRTVEAETRAPRLGHRGGESEQ